MREETKYLVNVQADTAILAVIGRAGYMNCRDAGQFLSSKIEDGCKRIIVQCRDCTAMDSTFLGIITSAAIKLRKVNGEIFLLNLSERNLELIENLGLSRLVKTASGESLKEFSKELELKPASSVTILAAHKSLIDADSANLEKFQDVIAFFQKENDNK